MRNEGSFVCLHTLLKWTLPGMVERDIMTNAFVLHFQIEVACSFQMSRPACVLPEK